MNTRPPSKKIYMSHECFLSMEKELDHLLHKERPMTTQMVTVAAANGDRSENADYTYGKKRLREIDRRVRFLQSRLNQAEVVHPERVQNPSVIYFGAIVEIEDTSTGDIKTFQILGVDEIDLKKGIISYESPLGKSLLLKKVDDEIIVRTPQGEMEFTIKSISYPNKKN